MVFEETDLEGAFLISAQPIYDERGFFARFFDTKEFESKKIYFNFSQLSLSHNLRKGVLRGLHFQLPPYEENKLIMCISGAIFDVIVDIRPNSPTYLQWKSFELKAEVPQLLYAPVGFAHGFQSLSDNSKLIYHMSAPYHAESAKGYRWDDPKLNIPWPETEFRILSERDRSWPLLS